MTTITRKDFNTMPIKFGGDLWNTWKLSHKVFEKFDNAEKFEYHIGSGLWVTVIITLDDGSKIKTTIHDSF